MSLENYSINIHAPFKDSSKKIKEPTFWLPFLPGFTNLNQLSDCSYSVKTLLSLGPVTHDTTLTFYFEPEKKTNEVRFTFSSKNKHVTGLGQLIISLHSDDIIKLEILLDLRLKGKKSLFFAPLLPSVKDSWAKNILTEVKITLENE
ncbi:hypothetical protein [Carnobacterium sp. TMP28]|uniref:hypothetical protein n=1 Tax=Carnobacterium sp. TMP28 TaxID=3397060 RepID=UPI0039E1256F